MKLREAVWKIEKLVPGGAGMARLEEGAVGFVDGALPGESVAVEAPPVRRGFAQAQRFRVLTESPERVTPPCPIAERCGGCDWQHLAYSAQLAHKGELIAEALRRTGGFHELPRVDVVASPHELAYRSRIRLHIDEHGNVGFFEKRSHRLISVQSCKVARPELERALELLQVAAAQMRRLMGHFETAELRVSPLSPERALCLTARADPEKARRLAAPLLELLERDFSVAVGGQKASFTQRFPLASGLELEVSPHAFVQVNWEVNLALIERVVAGARARESKRFLDAYAGAGNFTLPLAAAGFSGVSVEAHPEAARSGREALLRYGFSAVEAVCDDAARALERFARAGQVFDLVLLDPPRAGASALLEPLLALAPPHIAYCSCDPVTLARDLRKLAASGYLLDEISGFDMFPGTHHVETLVWLTRTPNRER